MPKSIRPRLLHVYGDESSQQKRHIVYGTLACEASDADAIIADIEAHLGNYPGELKWNKIGKGNVHIYERFTETLFEWIIKKKGKLRFRAIVIDGQKARYDEYSAGDRDLAMQQFVFELLYTYAKDHAKHPSVSIAVYLDHRDQRHPLDLQRIYLNKRDRSEHHRNDDLFTAVESRDSKGHRLIQAADFLAGAVAFVTRGDHKSGKTGDQKKSIASRIAWLAQIPVLDQRAVRMGIKPGQIETLGLGTPSHIGLKGVGIWHLDWGAEREAALRRMSKDQLACFLPATTLGEVRNRSYVVSVLCPRCNRRRTDILRDVPFLGEVRVSATPKFRCRKASCQGIGVILLEPDPMMPIFAPSH